MNTRAMNGNKVVYGWNLNVGRKFTRRVDISELKIKNAKNFEKYSAKYENINGKRLPEWSPSYVSELFLIREIFHKIYMYII